jgi:hypothetical protein
LLTIIREGLAQPLRRLYDSDDFLHITFADIFTHHFTEEVLCSPQSLWRYLQKMAANKVRDANRKYLIAQRRNLNREVQWDSIRDESEIWSRDLAPEEALLLKELVEDRLAHLLNQLPLILRGMIELVIAGHSVTEIARLLQQKPKRVYRAMEWLKRKILEDRQPCQA